MKINLILGAGVLALSGFAFASGSAEKTHSATPAAQVAATAGKLSKKEAKMACKAEGKKGNDLRSCVKEKTM